MLVRRPVFKFIIWFSLFLVHPYAARAQEPPLAEPARALARKIAATLGARESIALTISNQSSMTAPEIEAARQLLELELRNHMAKSPNPAEVQVIFSQSFRGLLWIAEISRRGASEAATVAMVETARPAEPGAPDRGVRFVIEKKLIVEQDRPILDIALPHAQKILSLLDPDGVSRYRQRDDKWEFVERVPFTGWKLWPRDIRGRLMIDERGDFRARLPGAVCDPVCRQSDDAWPLDTPANMRAFMPAGHNFFEDTAKARPPFYSAARIDNSMWLMAGIDGRTQLVDAGGQPQATFSGWGSELADIDTTCAGKLALVTKPRDWTELDSVQAFQIVNRQPVAVSDALEFAGPVVALWPSGAGAAVAISRDLKTGRYAAFSLAISCSP